MTEGFVPPAPTDRPELFFALVAATGTDLDTVVSRLDAELSIVGYVLETPIRLSHLIHGIKGYEHLCDVGVLEEDRIRMHMDAGDEMRRGLKQGSALAALAVNEVRRRRHAGQKQRPATAYLFRTLKHPKEVELLRGIYGASLIVISVYEPAEKRAQRLALRIKHSRERHLEQQKEPTWNEDDPHEAARKLLVRDQEDDVERDFGQSVRKTFPLADFFLDVNGDVRRQLERLIHLLFNHPHVSPLQDEYAMFMAQAAALRSADTSRQVGAVIVDEDGELVATGCNEVPKPGGGVYWSGDEPDHRDFTQGTDPNALMGREILEEIFKHLREAGWLSEEHARKDPDALAEDARRMELFEHARVGNLIEFGRVVHAEMNALVHAARQGLPVRGRSLYCTTFPCHGCARHIIGAGIGRVVYIEPYPKSLASRLYPEAIRLGASGTGIAFDPFTGVAPSRYLDFFRFGRRKDTYGYADQWVPRQARPRVRPLGNPPPWLLAELQLCGTLLKALQGLSWI